MSPCNSVVGASRQPSLAARRAQIGRLYSSCCGINLLTMPPSRVFSFEQTLEQLKHPWSSENAFSVLAKSAAIDDALSKIREKWDTLPLICRRQLMIMLASELEHETSLKSHMDALASHVLQSENSDDWLRYIASTSTGAPTPFAFNVSHQPLFSEHVPLPERTCLPDESVVCKPPEERAMPSAAVVARAAASKTVISVAKPTRPLPPVAAPAVAAVRAPSRVDTYKPKNMAELVDFDPVEPEVQKGPQKKKRCR